MRAVAAVLLCLGLCLCLGLAICSGCASAPPPKPAPPDPAEETVTALTQVLKLDAAQQKRMRELLKELSDRDDVIHAGWLNGKRVRPEEITASHSQFERDFFMVLTTEQRLVFIQNRARLSLRAR
jgi:hypothetical protein